jgi:hypothetical protein
MFTQLLVMSDIRIGSKASAARFCDPGHEDSNDGILRLRGRARYSVAPLAFRTLRKAQTNRVKLNYNRYCQSSFLYQYGTCILFTSNRTGVCILIHMTYWFMLSPL